jgi:DNA helicase-2/ATP-dependent DNA helicase PcrA
VDLHIQILRFFSALYVTMLNLISKRCKALVIPVAVSGIGGLFDSKEADIVFGIFSYIGEFKKIWDREIGEGLIPKIEDIYTYASEYFLLPNKKEFLQYFKDLKGRVKKSRRVSLQGLYGDILWGLGISNEEMHSGTNEVMLYNLGRISQAITDYEATRTYTTYRDIKGFCWFIKHYAESNYDAGAGDDRTLALNAVQVMTLHGTKGLGFPVVFMPYCVKRKDWPLDTGYLDPEKFDFSRYKGSVIDERRLFYVGITRAKKFLYVSYPKNAINKKRQRKPLPFFNEIPDNLCITKPIADPTHRKKTTPKQNDTDIRFPTSYSELSYFISCGYDYKLRFIYGFNPQLVEALGYGKQIHNIINMLHKKAQDTGKLPSLKDAIGMIRQHFYLRYASDSIQERLAKSALKCIEKYMKMWEKDFSLSVKTEKPFELDVEKCLNFRFN